MARRQQNARRPQMSLVEEPCTLVYNNLNPKELPFEDFSLIIRANHKFMVEEITEQPEQQSMRVKLGFQASIKNAYLKLGPRLANLISINKMSQYVKDTEIPRLEELRRKFGFNTTDATEVDYPETSYRSLPPPVQQQEPAPKRRRTKPMPTVVESDEEPIDI